MNYHKIMNYHINAFFVLKTGRELLEFMKYPATTNQILFDHGISVYESHKRMRENQENEKPLDWRNMPNNNFDPRLGFNVINQGRT